MDKLEWEALKIRRNFVATEKMFNAEGLALIVCPGREAYEASLHAAREELAKQEPRNHFATIDETLEALYPARGRRTSRKGQLLYGR